MELGEFILPGILLMQLAPLSQLMPVWITHLPGTHCCCAYQRCCAHSGV